MFFPFSSYERLLCIFAVKAVENRHRDQHDDHKQQGRRRAAVEIIRISEELRFDQISDKIIFRSAEHAADDERADRRDEYHRRAGNDAGYTERQHHPPERGKEAGAEIARGLYKAFVDFCHNRVQRQYHKRNIVIHHAEHHRAGGIDELQGRKSDAVQEGIDYAVVLENRLPCVGAQKKIHPHRKHDEHRHHFLTGKAQARHRKGKRIREHKTNRRGDRRKINAFDKRRQILHGLLDVVERKSARFIRKREINDQQQRKNREKEHPQNIRIRRPFGVQLDHASSPPVTDTSSAGESDLCMIWISSGVMRSPISEPTGEKSVEWTRHAFPKHSTSIS